MRHRDVIAIGTSAGGIHALTTVVAGLPKDLDAAVIAVMHLPTGGRSFLARALATSGPLPAADAEDGEPIERGRIYVAPPDCHLQVAQQCIQLSRGPREGRQRPAINVTFRSVAMEYGGRAIGVVLTGMLDDGTAGLWDIKRSGGVAVVQDPDEADFPAMPVSALQEVAVDHRARLADIGPLLTRLSSSPAAQTDTVSDADRPVLSYLTCPECRSPLWEHERGGVREYRCRVGHAYSTRALHAGQAETQERKLYEAMVALEESGDLAEYLAARQTSPARGELLEEAEKMRHHASALRRMIQSQDVVKLD